MKTFIAMLDIGIKYILKFNIYGAFACQELVF